MSDISEVAEETAVLATVNRTFRFCDPRSNLLASVSLSATVEVEPEPGISQEEAELRFRRAFRLTFVPIVKGKESESIYQTDGEPRSERKPKRVLSEEHKRRMQEGRRARMDQANGDGDERETYNQAEDAAAVILTGLDKSEWRGKSDIMTRTVGPLSDSDWSAGIGWLLENSKIEKQGKKRGSQYRRVS